MSGVLHSQGQNGPAKGAGRFPWLVISVGINVLLVGLLLGGIVAARQMGPVGFPFVGPRMVLEAMPEPRKQELAQAVRAERKAFVEIALQSRAARRALRQALQNQAYSSAEVQEALAQLRRADNARAQVADKTFLVLLEKLTPQERQLVAKALHKRERPPRRNGDPRQDRQGKGEDAKGEGGKGDMARPPAQMPLPPEGGPAPQQP